MVTKGDLAKLILADKVQLLNGADDWQTLLQTNIKSTHDEIKDIVRAGAQYFHSPADIMLVFTLDLTQDVVAELITKHTRNAQGALTNFAWSFKMTAKDATTSTLTVNGVLRDLEFDGPQSGSAKAICGVRVTDQVLD